MASIIYQTQKNGRVYAYSSESYWDKDLKKVRTRKKYLGRYDPETKQIITKQDKASKASTSDPESGTIEELKKQIKEKDKLIAEKDRQISKLTEDMEQINRKYQDIRLVFTKVEKLMSGCLK